MRNNNIKKQFLNNKPFPYLIINNFLNKNIAKKLREEIKKEKFEFKESDLFEFYQTKDLISTKNQTIKSFYDLLNSLEFKEKLEKITGIKAYGRIDSSSFIYKSENYLLPHDDRLEKRRLAYIYYLNEDFKKEDGGTLDLFNDNRIVKSIVPKFNTLIIFAVKENVTFHQVSEVLTNKERITITGWFNK